MKNFVSLGLVGSLLLVASATAQPAIYSLGGGVPASVTSPVGGTYFMGGVAASGVLGRWSLSGAGVLTAQDLGGSGPGYISDDGTVLVGSVLNTSPTYTGNTATGVSPAFSTTPTLVSAALPTNEFAGTIWTAGSGLTTRIPPIPVTPALMCYGQGSSGGSGGIFLSGHAISGNGRYVVGQGYISNYNSAAGTTIATSTFTWRPWIWDSVTNTQRILPTPFRTSSNTWRRRTGTGYAVSNDGLVIAGYQEHSVATTPTADPDGARPVVWRWNSGTSSYDMTYLPNGVNGSGFPYTVTATPTSMQMNTLGTIIVGKAVDNGGGVYLAKWTWDAGTSTWNAPVSIGSNLTSPATWLPASVTSCGQPPTLTISGMSEDGNTIVGQAVYSTCSGFMSGGFIWHASDGFITDWYDYLNEAGAPDVAPNGYYGPIGDLGDPAKGLPRLGFPTDISPDGSAVVSFQGGTQRTPGAVSTLTVFAGGACSAPVATTNPSSGLFSNCTTGFILNAAANGTGPFTFQWYRGAAPLADGTTVDGTTITGAQTFQCRLANAHPSDAGSYTCVITGACGSTTTTAGVWSVDPAVPTVANDTCSTALNVGEGTFTFNPCGAYIDDVLTPSCVASSNKDVWFRYTPTFTGDARIETCGASFDTVLSVFTDCSGGELACNDDVNSGPGGCTASRSRLRVPVTAGVPVLVRSAAKGSLFSFTGSVVISQAPAIPANDECSAPVTIDMGTTAFNLAEATTNGFATCQPTAGSVRDLWYSFAPSCDGVFTINTCGSTMTNPILSVVDVCGGTEIFCNDNVGSGVSGCTSNQARILNVPVRGANPVLIRVAVSGTTVPSPATGVINIIKTGCLPDYNNDGNTDQDDVAYLINVVAGGDNPTGANPDFNCDGNVDQDDISALINVIAGGACP